MPQQILTISTRGAGLYEFTDEAAAFVAQSGRGEGLLTLFVRHTSCSLTIRPATPTRKRPVTSSRRWKRSPASPALPRSSPRTTTSLPVSWTAA